MKTERIPISDISHTDDNYIVRCELPGVDREDLDINIEAGRLLVSGCRSWNEEGRVLLQEIPDGNFRRTFLLDDSLGTEGITAEFRDGLLVLLVPKQERLESRKIPISKNRID